MNYFEVKVKYQKLQQDGKTKNVNEPYLVNAISFSDAEERINKALEPYISGDFFVNRMAIANYSDIIKNEKGDKWFKCKISFIAIDEKSGKERKTNTYALVEAVDVSQAKELIEGSMEGTVCNYEIPSVGETNIQDVFDDVLTKDEVNEKYVKGEIRTGDYLKEINPNISDDVVDMMNE